MANDWQLKGLSEYFHDLENSLMLDWDRVASIIEGQEGADLSKSWTQAASFWMVKLADEQEGNLCVFETENLIVMSPTIGENGENQKRLAKNLERALGAVIAYLGSVAESVRYGKMGVLVFTNPYSYANYIAEFYPEGSVVPMSGGMCITEGYVHVALYEDEWGDLLSVFSHEASHAYVSHLTLPAWMDEAIAMRMETLVTGREEYHLDRELFDRHQELWNWENLEKFKSGESWSIAGDFFELSYQLAEILWKKIETNLNAQASEIQELIKTASWEDAGESALQSVFGIGLDDLIRSFLGDSIQ